MASQLTADKLQQLHSLFGQHDLRGDAKIGISQLGDCLRVCGANPSEETIRQLQQELSAHSVKRICFKDFLAIYESVQLEDNANHSDMTSMANDMISCLSCFDEQNTGYIPAHRLKHILTSCGERLTDTEVDQLLSGRVNDQGMVNYAELVKIILNS